jgi:hypothetical protein
MFQGQGSSLTAPLAGLTNNGGVSRDPNLKSHDKENYGNCEQTVLASIGEEIAFAGTCLGSTISLGE